MRSVAGSRLSGMFGLVAAMLVMACEKPSHENVEKWRATVKGPSKLADALKDSSLDADLRAHAAQALVSLDKSDAVEGALGGMPDAERQPVVEKLAPRLWTDSKLTEELQVPTAKQLAAKDALFGIRVYANDKTREEIDGYLIDWLSGYYEGRATLGRHSGEKIIRTIGAKAAPKLMAAAKAILADPGTGSQVAKLGDNLLLGIAYATSPETVEFLLRLADKPQGIDETLPTPERIQVRAMGALYQVYAVNQEAPRADRKLLAPHTGLLQAIAASDEQPGENVNVAYDLIAAVGAPECVAPMKVLAGVKDEPRRWRAVQYGLRCGGTDAIVPMAEALPPDASYEEGILSKYFWDKIADLGPGAAAPARQLLGSKSWVARLTGVRILERFGSKTDAAALRKLQGDATRARGWWGKDPKEKKKPEPTLGALASAAANKLEMKR
jgi:hypothetical protein